MLLMTIYVKLLKVKEVLRFDDEIIGNLRVAAYKSSTIMESVKLDDKDILILGDRHSVIEYAVNSGVKLIVITGGGEVKRTSCYC